MSLTLGIAQTAVGLLHEAGVAGGFGTLSKTPRLCLGLATALHSLAVTEKRGLFKSWTVLLAIFAFSLSLMGTFLVRSGVLTSVHAFASNPERGIFILALLGLCGSVALGIRHQSADRVRSVGRYDWISRESFLLLNNLLLIVAALAVMQARFIPWLSTLRAWAKFP